MCSIRFPFDDEDASPRLTDPASAPGVRAFNDLIRKLKCCSAHAAAKVRHRKQMRDWSRKWSTSERGKEALREYERNNRTKKNAKRRVRRALMSGRLVKASRCEQCGTGWGRIDGHHDDYALPLVVRWLCRRCHVAWHLEHGEAPNG
jgi:hypothetical protein